MAQNSKIQWTAHTWNPIWGCRKVSAGCKYCYAERIIEGRYGQQFKEVRKTGAATFGFPIKLHKKLTGKEPFNERLVFTCSMSDFFIEQGDPFRVDMWRIIKETPNLIYQILTKRPERILACLPADWGEGYKNVWLGISAERSKEMKLRLPIFSEVPALVKFISIEPLIGEINLFDFDDELKKIDWLIVGGESGNKTGKYGFRPCKIDWILSLVKDAKEYNIPIFVKQLGTHLAQQNQLSDLHGGNIDEFPEAIQFRQFPLICKSL